MQSSAPGEPRDADVLAAATGAAAAHRVSRAPHVRHPLGAADGRRRAGAAAFTVDDLAAELVWPAGAAVGLVEGVGGPRSPIAVDGDNVDFARALRPDLVVLVGDAGLGTINAVRLSVQALDDFPVIVALNRYGDDPLHARNRDFLVDDAGLDVVTAQPAQLAATVVRVLG